LPRSFPEALRRPATLVALSYGLVVIAGAAIAYWQTFTGFTPYDDEGTMLASLLLFVQGQPLYSAVFTNYGPFYFEIVGGLFELSGHAVNHDAGRVIVVIEWITTSLLVGIACQRLSSSLLLGVTGMITGFAVLALLTAEPLHPVGLSLLLLGVTALALVARASRRPWVAGAVLGSAVAALLTTKVNLGVFAIAALLFAAAFTWPPAAARRPLGWLIAAGFIAMPFVLMASDLDKAAIRDFVFLSTVSCAALALIGAGLRPQLNLREGSDDEAVLTRRLLAAVGAFVVAAIVIVAVIVITGPSPADVYDGMITQASRLPDVFMMTFAPPAASAEWAVAALATAAAAVLLRRRSQAGATVWPAVGRIVVGLVLWLVVTDAVPLGLTLDSAGLPLAMVLAWVAALPPRGTIESAVARFARLALPALALGEALQVYPVAGQQTEAAKLLFVPVGAMCLGDGLHELRTWAAARGGLVLARVGTVVPVATAALAAMLTWTVFLRPGIAAEQAYRAAPPLPLQGATRLHLSPGDVLTYTRLVALLRGNCTAFVGYPSVNSLYLWSGIEPPRGGLLGPWMYYLPSDRQERIVDELRRADHPCALRNDGRAAFWLQGRQVPDTPLVRYIFDDFRPSERVGDFTLLLPKRE
jgi:hypothetical protein